MSTQLDILALEPFYGGMRRTMLQTIQRCSRHRWKVLKLPPRRLERRLVAASRWFGEQILRGEMGAVDLVFASEAMNLADLFRIVPQLSHKPSVVYFHDNQLPAVIPDHPRATRPVVTGSAGPLDLVNLNTAMAATEIWFNSQYHMGIFAARSAALVHRHSELANQDPMPRVQAKARYVPPPIDLALVHDTAASGQIQRDRRTIIADLRDGIDAHPLVDALHRLTEMKEAYTLLAVGPSVAVRAALGDIPHQLIDERDELAQVHGMLRATIFLGLRMGATADDLLLKAIVAGALPIVPAEGVYAELLPANLHPLCLHDGTLDSLIVRLLDSWYAERPLHLNDDLVAHFISQFDGVPACRNIDQRLEQLVRQPVRTTA